ncbi:hypothetical protein [Bradyrhizobium sp. sGM-13]|uniref:hypothetical protein n=1 Tax=Bradyrhizobium sp. sGM-13 TaxID=2831781 RepID=UPI001BCB195A|nr:hypothetical protein [Bradyrhizobium sp. sGM-13]
MLAMQALLRYLNQVAARLLVLLDPARNRYRPELHYMRGPGPKWYEKHQGGAI